jgi:5-methylcytosine-specific restriction endonuclease McrA
MCGAAAGDADPYSIGRKVRLTLAHIIDKSKGGTDTPENLRAQCTNCNEGLQNIAMARPSRVHVLTQVRRAEIKDQLFLLAWLNKKFGTVPAKKK